jgi:hypothetical protein
MKIKVQLADNDPFNPDDLKQLKQHNILDCEDEIEILLDRISKCGVPCVLKEFDLTQGILTIDHAYSY